MKLFVSHGQYVGRKYVIQVCMYLLRPAPSLPIDKTYIYIDVVRCYSDE